MTDYTIRKDHKYISNLIEYKGENKSIIEIISELPAERQKSVLEDIIERKYPERGWDGIKYDWELWQRPKQRYPEELKFKTYTMLMGRGGGKTRSGAEACRQLVDSGKLKHGIMIAPTTNDVHRVMLRGSSGLFSVCPKWNYPTWNPSYTRLEFPNGAVIEYFSAAEPARIRGTNCDFAWCDEVSSWQDEESSIDEVLKDSAFDMAQFALRLGADPRMIITTTPKPHKILLNVLKDPDTYTITGGTFENKANLPESFLNYMVNKYAGTTLGRQELDAEIMAEMKGALWSMNMIEAHRIRIPQDKDKIPDLVCTVLAIDPAMTGRKTSNQTGFCVAGLGEDEHIYILHMSGSNMSPSEWATKALNLYDYYGCAAIVAEVNQGGDLVEENIKSQRKFVNIQKVWAVQGKYARAEPVVGMYEQGKIHHVGSFPDGEQQMITYNPITNPKGAKDIVDSTVYATMYLMNKVNQDFQYYLPAVGGYRDKLTHYRVR